VPAKSQPKPAENSIWSPSQDPFSIRMLRIVYPENPGNLSVIFSPRAIKAWLLNCSCTSLISPGTPGQNWTLGPLLMPELSKNDPTASDVPTGSKHKSSIV